MLALAVAIPLLGAMMLLLRACWRGDAWTLLALALLCVVWLGVDKAFEGPRLLVFSRDHGLVLSDLVALVIGMGGLFGWLRRRRVTAQLGETKGAAIDRPAVGRSTTSRGESPG